MDNREIEQEIIEEKKSISHLRLFFLFLFIIVAAGFIMFYYGAKKEVGSQKVDASVFDVRLQNVEEAIPLHEKRIAKLEEQVAALTKTPAPPNPNFPAPPAPNGQPQGQTDINDRVSALEKAVAAPKSHAAAQNSEQVLEAITLISSFHRLSNKVMAGRPFANELSDFEEKFGADKDKSLTDIIAALSPYAESGIPTISNLLSSFDDAVANLKNHENALPDNASFWDKLMYNIRHLISVRRIDRTQGGNSVDAIVGRAEDDLSGDEVEAAVAEIKSLPEPQQSSFTAWLEDARINTMAPSYVDQMEELVMKKAFAAKKTDHEQ